MRYAVKTAVCTRVNDGILGVVEGNTGRAKLSGMWRCRLQQRVSEDSAAVQNERSLWAFARMWSCRQR